MSAQPPQSPDGWYNEAFRRDQDYPDTVVIHGERTVRKMKELEIEFFKNVKMKQCCHFIPSTKKVNSRSSKEEESKLNLTMSGRISLAFQQFKPASDNREKYTKIQENETEEKCFCGLSKENHEENVAVSTGTDEIWSSIKHTKELETNAYGLLYFKKMPQREADCKEYVRISDSTRPQDVWELMQKHWALKPPTLIIAIVGGNKNSYLDICVKKSLEEGLVQVIKKTDVYLLTGATSTRVTKLASKAFYENYQRDRTRENACIGIVPWGCVCGKEKLEHKMGKVHYQDACSLSNESALLDHNHTQFLLVDNGTHGQFGTEREFKTNLQQYLYSNVAGKTIPSISILVGGGKNACDQVKGNIECEPHIPTVVIKGSGGLADILANALDAFGSDKKWKEKKRLHGIKKIAERIDSDLEDEKTVEIINSILENSADVKLLIYDPKNAPDGLHLAMIEAYKTLCDQTSELAIELGLKFGNVEIAAQNIDRKITDIEFMRNLLLRMIENGKASCVAFFLTNEVDLEEIVKPDMFLTPLYKMAKSEHFKKLLKALGKEDTDWQMEDIDTMLTKYLEEDYTSCSGQVGIVRWKYEQRAADVLTILYEQDSKSAVDLVKRRMPLWGKNNVIALAANGGCRDFVAHPCCQKYLNDIWLGRDERKTVKSAMKPSRLRTIQGYVPSVIRRQQKHKENDKTPKHDNETPTRRTRILQTLLFCFLVPKGKLILHSIIYLVFLCCFTFLVLVKKGEDHEIIHYTLVVVVAALTIDEVREVTDVRKKTCPMKFWQWFKSGWNKLDFIAIVLFFIGFGMSFYDRRIESVILAIDLSIWFMRFAQVYRSFYTLGLYLIMIYKMVKHMIGFVLVLVVAVLAYGTLMHTLLFPDVPVSWEIIFKVLFRPFLLVFGELGLNSYTLSNNSTVYGTAKVAEWKELVAVVGMCAYLFLANVLLLNMLIAVFNNIYEDIKENADKVWRFDRYGLIMEYYNKPFMPVPLSAITSFYRICTSKCVDGPSRGGINQFDNDALGEFQRKSLRTYFRQQEYSV